MSVIITQEPSSLGMLRDRERYVLKATPEILSPAVTGRYIFKNITLDNMPEGYRVVVNVNGDTYVWESRSGLNITGGLYELWNGEGLAPSPTDLDTLSYFRSRLNECYGVSELFDVDFYQSSPASAKTGLVFTAKQPGALDLDMVSTDESGNNVIGFVGTMASESVRGKDAEVPENYSVMIQLQTASNSLSTSVDYSTEWMYFAPDKDGKVVFVPEILSGLIKEQELPLPAEKNIIETATGALTKYRIRYAEAYGNPLNIQRVLEGSWKLMMDGELTNNENRSDWDVISESMSAGGVKVIGDASGRICDKHVGVPVYLYLCSMSEENVTVSVEYVYADGTSEIEEMTDSIRQGEIKRVILDKERWDEPNMLAATVTIGSWMRTYNVRPALYGQRICLLTDKYGMLRPIALQHLKRERVTEGEGVVCNGRYRMNVTEGHDQWTAKTEALSGDEMQPVADSARGRHNYILSKDVWREIVIAPGTLTAYDSENDLQIAELSFRFGDVKFDSERL